MANSKLPERLLLRWATLKGLATIVLFLIITAIFEVVVVIYALNLGVKDATILQWNTSFPGTNWNIGIAISPLFHLVPVAVLIALLFAWIYYTKKLATRPLELRGEKIKTAAKRGKELQYQNFFGKIKSKLSKATIRSATTVLLVFAVFIAIASLLAYPKLIYQLISNAYQNPATLSSVKSASQTLAPIGSIFSSIQNALLSVAPSFRGILSGLGNILSPLTRLDNVGKYLAFQNIAAWISALVVLFYGEFVLKGFRYKKKR